MVRKLDYEVWCRFHSTFADHLLHAETENGKQPDTDAVEVQLKKASTKAVDLKEVMRVDTILHGVMRKVHITNIFLLLYVRCLL